MLNVQLDEREQQQMRALSTGYHGATMKRYLNKVLNSFDIEDVTEENFIGFKLAKKIIREDILEVLENMSKNYADNKQGGEYE